MKSLKEAIKEYFNSLTFSKKSKLVWTGKGYTVSYFFNESTIKKLGWEVVL
jgi:hypothetical protein